MDVFYDLVRPGCSLGMGPRFDFESRHKDVLRVSIPVREARIAHVKTIPAGWNLGYGDNKFRDDKRIAVIEGTRLNAIRYETYQRQSETKSEDLKSLLSHLRIACVELPEGEWNAGDVLTSSTTIWNSFLTTSFKRTGDGKYVISVFDARSGEMSNIPVDVQDELPNEHLFYSIDQLIAGLLMLELECLRARTGVARVTRTILTHWAYASLVIAKRIPFVSKMVSLFLSPIKLC